MNCMYAIVTIRKDTAESQLMTHRLAVSRPTAPNPTNGNSDMNPEITGVTNIAVQPCIGVTLAR